MFKQLLAAVLAHFNISSFAKNDEGKSVLSEDQKKELTKKWGNDFVPKFLEELEKYEANPPSAEEAKALKDAQDKLGKLQAEFDQYKKDAQKKEKDLQQQVDDLSDDPESDPVVEGNKGKPKGKKKFEADMKLMHNLMLDSDYNGTPISGDASIDTTELRTEFGKYISSERMEIVRALTQKVTSVQYMKTVVTDKTVWRASRAIITSVVQQFVAKWTPSGKGKFTPIEITQRKHKINVPITPADIMDDVIGYLYDEGLEPKDMPIVKYIVEQLVLPKVEEDREMLLLATGKYEALAADINDGDAAQETGKSMDGYCTILEDQKALKDAADPSAAPINWLLDGVTLTPENIVDKMNEAADSVAPLYKRKKMFIHADPDLVTMYNRAYQKLYPNTKNEDGKKNKLDFTNFTFAELDGMTGCGHFFITPKENFIHLLSKNKGASKIFMQGENYDVKVFAEYREAVGFAVAEALFAYVKPGA